jgi:hypothetical protein
MDAANNKRCNKDNAWVPSDFSGSGSNGDSGKNRWKSENLRAGTQDHVTGNPDHDGERQRYSCNVRHIFWWQNLCQNWVEQSDGKRWMKGSFAGRGGSSVAAAIYGPRGTGVLTACHILLVVEEHVCEDKMFSGIYIWHWLFAGEQAHPPDRMGIFDDVDRYIRCIGIWMNGN